MVHKKINAAKSKQAYWEVNVTTSKYYLFRNPEVRQSMIVLCSGFTVKNTIWGGDKLCKVRMTMSYIVELAASKVFCKLNYIVR